jgi:hypothetical protein
MAKYRIREANQLLEDLEAMESSGELIKDQHEAQAVLGRLGEINLIINPLPQFRERIENLIRMINERSMSTYPLFEGPRAFSERQTLPTPQEELQEQQQHQREAEAEEQKQKEQEPKRNDDDELAATAGKLLSSVSDNTSEKFQNSQFLTLMRRLRDREVRVQGEDIVEVGSTLPPSSTSPIPAPVIPASSPHGIYAADPSVPASTSQVPPIDRNILNHAALDFELPVDSEEEIRGSFYE